MNKIDYKKELKHLYRPSAKRVEIVDLPKMNFLMVDGVGNPNTSDAYKEAVEVLYTLSYAIKFMIKRGKMAVDYGVMPLEGLWWVDDMTKFDVNNKDAWQWTSMIMQPDIVSKEVVEEATEQVRQKKNPTGLSKLRFESFTEGKAAQILHIGPFSAEGPTIRKVHDFISENGNKISGKHHEIYLSDIRKAAPEKWKTVIRQPFQ